MSAQAVGAPLGSLESGSGSGCDRLQRQLQSNGVIPKEFREQQAQWALGKELAAKVDRDNEIIIDQFIVQYLNHLEQAVFESAELPGCFVVKVLRVPEPNAYSLPGGFIYLTTGLIRLVENEAQLVAALSHETAHVTARHLTRMDGQLRFGRRLALFGGPAGYAVRRFVGPLITVKLVRDKEFEADQLGLQYDILSGYDPLEFCRLLQTILSAQAKESFVERLYDPHPLTTTRIRRLQAAIRSSRQSEATYIVNTSEFAQMKIHFEAVNGHHGQ